MEGVRVHLLGGFRLFHQGRRLTLPMSARRLIAFLAVRDRPVRRASVAGVLWPETTDERAATRLRSVLWKVRKMPILVVEATRDLLELATGVRIDVREEEARARRLIHPSARSTESDLHVGPLDSDILPEWSEDWLELERERFRQLRLHALEALGHRLGSDGRHADAVDAGLAAVMAEPFRESAHRTLIRAFLEEGNPGEALQQYLRFRQALQEELRLDPSHELEGLVRGLSRDESSSEAGDRRR